MLEAKEVHPEKLLHREITEKIIGVAFDVHREFGYGFLERVYQRALQVELIRRGAKAEIEKRSQVRYQGNVVGDYDSDLIVDGCVIVELKVNSQYDRRDEAQSSRLPASASGSCLISVEPRSSNKRRIY